MGSDGELSFRGPQVFTGYWHNDDATAEALDADGWFATGDLGEVDDDGYVRITGRKKEIIVTAGGKNVAPAVLEDRVRANAYVSQCLVVGDGKPFVAALVTIDPEAWTGDLDDPALRTEIQKAIDDANSQVSQAESIRKFQILARGLDRGQRLSDAVVQGQAQRRAARLSRHRRGTLRQVVLPLGRELIDGESERRRQGVVELRAAHDRPRRSHDARIAVALPSIRKIIHADS